MLYVRQVASKNAKTTHIAQVEDTPAPTPAPTLCGAKVLPLDDPGIDPEKVAWLRLCNRCETQARTMQFALEVVLR
jgi:hypothetical protein